MLRAIISGAIVGLVISAVLGLVYNLSIHEIFYHVTDTWGGFQRLAFDVVTDIRMEIDPTFMRDSGMSEPIVIYSGWHHS